MQLHDQSDDVNKVPFPKVKRYRSCLLLLKRMESLDVRHTLNCFNWEYLSVCGYTVAVEQACGKLLP